MSSVFFEKNLLSFLQKWIVFEGINGCGKTTQINKLACRLRAASNNVLVTSDFDELHGKEIKKILFALSPRAQLCAINLLRTQNLFDAIVPAIFKGSWVLSDRHIMSTYAYQDLCRSDIEDMHRIACTNIAPATTVVIDVDPQEAHNRCLKRDGTEKRVEDLHKTRWKMLKAVDWCPGNKIIVDGAGSPEDVEIRVVRALKHLFY